MANTLTLLRQWASPLANTFGVGFIDWLDGWRRIRMGFRVCLLWTSRREARDSSFSLLFGDL